MIKPASYFLLAPPRIVRGVTLRAPTLRDYCILELASSPFAVGGKFTPKAIVEAANLLSDGMADIKLGVDALPELAEAIGEFFADITDATEDGVDITETKRTNGVCAGLYCNAIDAGYSRHDAWNTPLTEMLLCFRENRVRADEKAPGLTLTEMNRCERLSGMPLITRAPQGDATPTPAAKKKRRS